MNRILIGFLLIGIFNIQSISQDDRSRFIVNFGQSITGNSNMGLIYNTNFGAPNIRILESSSTRNSNVNFGIGVNISKNLILQGSIGVAEYGFNYRALVTLSQNDPNEVPFGQRGEFYTRLMEVGLSLAHRTSIAENTYFIIQPGFTWYTNPKERRTSNPSMISIFQNSNNFSAILFLGIEMPLTSDRWIVQFGLQAKHGIGNFSQNFITDDSFTPYAVGLQVGLGYSF